MDSLNNRTAFQAYGLSFEIRASNWPDAESARQAAEAIEAWVWRQPEDTLRALHGSLLAYDNGTHTDAQRIHLAILWGTIEHIVDEASHAKRATCEVLALRGPLQTIH